MDARNGYHAHIGADTGNIALFHQSYNSGPGYAHVPYSSSEYHLDTHLVSTNHANHGQTSYQQPLPQYNDIPSYDHRLEPPPNYQYMDHHSLGSYPMPHVYSSDPHHDVSDSRSASFINHGHGPHSSSDRKDHLDRHGSQHSSHGSGRDRKRDERKERHRDYGGSRRKGSREHTSNSHSSQTSSSRKSEHPASRSHSEPDSRGKSKKSSALPYASYFRPYSVNRLYLDAIDLKRMHSGFSLPMDMSGVKIHWPRTIPFTTSMANDPPIPLNFSIPMSINNEIVPRTWSIRPIPSPGPGQIRIQVRVLLIRGSPIDISAPKSGSVHSNNNIMFLLLERARAREGSQNNLCAPGGLFDPLLDASGETDAHRCPSEQSLIRTAIRTVKEQLSLDLSPCTHWFRFMDVEYAHEGPSVDDRVVYFIPSVFELIPNATIFPELWKAHRNVEIHSETLMHIERLKNRLGDTEIGSPQYGEIKSQLAQKEAETKYFTYPPQNDVPEKPMLLIRVNPSSTNGQRALNYTLQNLLELDPKKENSNEDTVELFLVAHRFDEFLQCYFGSCVLLHVAMMRDYILRGQRPFQFHGVPLVCYSSDPNAKKRPREDLESRFTGALDNQLPLEALVDVKVKREIKTELPAYSSASEHSSNNTVSPNSMPPFYQSATSSLHHHSDLYANTSNNRLDYPSPPRTPEDPRLSQVIPTEVNNPIPEVREYGVPLDSSRNRPPKMPEHRDYRLMQAFRYFDLNRLGYLQGGDLVDIFLSLGLGITRKVATEFAAAADVSLPHYPFIESGFASDKRIRYKPVCDWLHSLGIQLPGTK